MLDGELEHQKLSNPVRQLRQLLEKETCGKWSSNVLRLHWYPCFTYHCATELFSQCWQWMWCSWDICHNCCMTTIVSKIALVMGAGWIYSLTWMEAKQVMLPLLHWIVSCNLFWGWWTQHSSQKDGIFFELAYAKVGVPYIHHNHHWLALLASLLPNYNYKPTVFPLSLEITPRYSSMKDNFSVCYLMWFPLL